jgi:choline dehydrogenase-like flavoprotein
VLVAGGRTIRCAHVVVACGAIETPRLLMRSGIAPPMTGKHLHLHPAVAIFGEFAEPVEPWHGPMQSVVCNEFSFLDEAYGFKLEAVPAHPGLGALALPWQGREAHRAQMERMRYGATLIALVRDRGAGSVSADGIRYALDPYDARHVRLGMERLSELLLAAGAQTVRSLHQRQLVLHADAAAGEREAFFSALRSAPAGANRMPVFSAHQMGTARMHRERTSGVVDGRGRLYGTDGVTIADASVFPAASGVNPMLTIMALAHRTARALLKE